MDELLKSHFSALGRKGGRKSRRVLESSDARKMVRIREARRAYREFHTRCFWSFDPNYRVTESDIPWMVDKLRTYGGRVGWEKAEQLCR